MRKLTARFWLSSFLVFFGLVCHSSSGYAQSLPAPWQNQDIGNVNAPGSASFASNIFTINNAGDTIYETADHFHFVYRSLTGDGEIVARVSAFTTGETWSQIGVMIRETVNPGSKHAYMSLLKSGNSVFYYRTATGGTSADVWPADGVQVPYWVKVTRAGNILKGFKSSNGTTWVEVGSVTIGMSSNVLVGLAVAGYDYQNLTVGKFSNVSVTGATTTQPPAAPTLNSATPASAQVSLNWSSSVNATGYKIKYGTTPGSYPNVVTLGNITSHVVTGLNNGATYYFVVSATNSVGESVNSNALPAQPTLPANNATDVSLVKIEHALANVKYTSNTVTVPGTGSSTVSISGGITPTIIVNGVDSGVPSKAVSAGERIAVRSKAPAAGQTSTLNITIGAQTIPWSITAEVIAPLPAISGTMSGYTAGSMNVGPSGAASFTIPVTISPGTAGMMPSLSLNYSSFGGNGLLGVGWSLSGLSAISRCPATTDQDGFNDGIDFDGNDRFCLDGNKLRAVAGTYGADKTEYRLENDPTTRIISYGTVADAPQRFKVWTKAGLVMEYGGTTDSRIEAKNQGGAAPNVLFWAINRTEDTLGNYFSITYLEDANSVGFRPYEIYYTGNSRSNPVLNTYNVVRFIYETRPDLDPKFVGGFPVQSAQRLSRIESLDANALFRSYKFTYQLSTASQRSQLISVQECGSDGSCFNPTNFNWQDLGAGDFNFNGPGTANNVPIHDGGVAKNYTGDFNGDGRTDMTRYVGTQGNGLWKMCLSQGSTFDCSSTWLAHSGPSWGDEKNNFVGDFNGDGKTDLTGYSGSDAAHRNWHMCFSTGSGFSCEFIAVHDGNRANNMLGDFNGDGRTDMGKHVSGGNWEICLSNGPGTSFSCSTWQGHSGGIANNIVGDFNGDGLSDIAGYTGSNGLWHIAFSNGANFYSPVNGSGQVVFWQGPVSGSVPNIIVGDFNGDGKTDLAGYTGSNGQWHVTLSTGTHFTDLGYMWTGHAGGAVNNVVGDFNGDGKSDIAGYTNANGLWDVRLSTGTNFYQKGTWQGHAGGATLSVLGDFNGDGKTDLAGYTNNSNLWHVTFPGGAFPDLLTKITNGQGAQTKIDYLPITAASNTYVKDSGAVYPLMDFIGPLYVVQSLRYDNGIGGENQTIYAYRGGRIHLKGRGFRGFRQVDSKEVQSGITTSTEYTLDYRYAGSNVTKVQQLLASGTILKVVNNTLALFATSSGLTFPYVSGSTTQENEINGSLVKTTTTTQSVNEFGDLTTISINYNNTHTETTQNSYTQIITDRANANPAWLLGRLTQSTVTKTAPGLPAQTRSSSFAYNTTAQGSFPASGLLIRESVEPGNAALRLDKTYTHDVWGNILESKSGKLFDTSNNPLANPVSRTLTTQYGPFKRFVEKTTNQLGHQETKLYNLSFLSSVADPNGLTNTFTYDGFGRPLQETRADGTLTRTRYYRCDVSCPALAKYFVRTDESGGAVSIVYFDLLDREIRAKAKGFNGTWILVDKEYNARGEVTRASEPYFEGQTPVYTAFEYDAIGRPTKKTTPDGTVTSTAYLGLTTETTNALAQKNTRRMNSIGLLESSKDQTGFELTYKYDPFGNLLELKDGAGNITQNIYDIRGNRTRITDPDSGATNFTYNAFGEITQQVNAKGQATSFVYDVLGRVSSRSEVEGTTQWTYDSLENGKGKPARVTQTGFEKEFRYDALARPYETITRISGKDYSSTTIFDQYGRVATLRYPTGFFVTNGYNANGYLQTVKRGSDNYSYWQANAVNARGQLEQQALGNGKTTTSTYDALSGRLQKIQTAGIQDLDFGFDKLGNLMQRRNLSAGRTENFQYDALNRLKQSQVVGLNAVNVVYDALGNITSRSDVGTYLYASSRPHAVTGITSGPLNNSYTYDANGNRTGSNAGAVSYASYNLPSAINNGATTMTFAYGPDRERFRQTLTGGTQPGLDKIYVGSLYEKETTGGVTKDIHYVPAGGQVVAIQTWQTNAANTLQYLHRDHLGSVQSISNESGTLVETLSYDAWGKRRNADWSTPVTAVTSFVSRGFTGHEHLDAVGLIHMNGRVYDPVIGRFLSVDPFVQVPDYSQSLNRYSYVLNNPLSLTDPSGFFFKNLINAVGDFFQSTIGKILVSATVGYFSMGFGTSLLSSLTGLGTSSLAGAVGGGFGFGFGSAFSGTLLSGGSLGDALRAGLMSGVVGGITAGVFKSMDPFLPDRIDTHPVSRIKNGLKSLTSSERAILQGVRMAGRGVFRGITAEALGGNFRKGFSYSLFGDAFDWAMLDFKASSYLDERLSRGLPTDQLKYLRSTLKTAIGPGQPKSSLTVDNVLRSNVGSFSTQEPLNGIVDYITMEKGPVMSFIGMNIPGVNSMSIFHDYFAVATETNSVFDIFTNQGTIPFAITAEYLGLGYLNESYNSKLIRN